MSSFLVWSILLSVEQLNSFLFCDQFKFKFKYSPQFWAKDTQDTVAHWLDKFSFNFPCSNQAEASFNEGGYFNLFNM